MREVVVWHRQWSWCPFPFAQYWNAGGNKDSNGRKHHVCSNVKYLFLRICPAYIWLWFRLDIIQKKICKWLCGLFYRPTAGQQTADTTITASAPCVCLICVCAFAITKKKEEGGVQTEFSFLFSVNDWTKVRESKDTRTENARHFQADYGKKYSRGNYLPVIRPSCFEYQRDLNSQTNSERLTNLCSAKW